MPDRQINAPIEEEMRKSYLDYAMSVIVGRALPGHPRRPQARAPPRALHDVSCSASIWNRGYKKSARVVGDCMGKFHPHGDSRHLRHARAHGPGVLAALSAGRRAGELRLDRRRPARRPCATPRRAWREIAHEMLADIDKDTVDFVAELRRQRDGAGGPARRGSPISSSTARPASRSAWPPTSRRTTSPRSSTGSWR